MTVSAKSSFTFTSLRSAGDSTWDQSEVVDLGSTALSAVKIYPQFLAGSTAQSTAGHYVSFYLSEGPDTATMSGGVAGGDGSYDPLAVMGDNPLSVTGLKLLGNIAYGDSASSAIEYNGAFTVNLPAPNIALVTFNQGVALSASTNVKVWYQTFSL